MFCKPNQVRLENIRTIIKKEWADSTTETYPYTPHDVTHCKKVEELLIELIPADRMKDLLSEEERFLLIASAWLHDIGMNPDLYRDKKDSNVRNKEKLAKWNKSVRDTHAERSARYVEDKKGELNLTDDECDIIKKMCLLHRQKTYKELEQQPWEISTIRVQLLIAYLRLADALHIPRKDDREFKTFMALGLDPVSRLHWFKSRYVNQVIIHPDKFTIVIVLRKPDPAIYPEKWDEKLKPLKEMLTRIVYDELDPIKDILAKGGVSVYLSIELRSEIDATMSESNVQELKELLNNMELLDTTLTPNAGSVIGTVLKQIELFIDIASPEISIEYLKDYDENILKDIVERRPCHVFLWKVKRMLEDKIKSKESAGKEKDTILSIQETINCWKSKRHQAISELTKTAYHSILKDELPILVYGYSDTIVECIDYYLTEKNNLDIYICEGRTKTEYRYNNRLIYSDGLKYAERFKEVERKNNDKVKRDILEIMRHKYNMDETSLDEELKNCDGEIRKEFDEEMERREKKLKLYYVADSCVSNLFSREIAKKVLFGANGIGNSGMVSHTLGHLAIADMAKLNKIPVYVLAETMKVGDLQVRRELQRSNQWLTTDIKFDYLVSDLINYNPREDIITPDKITAFITEKGSIQPATEIWRYKDDECYALS